MSFVNKFLTYTERTEPPVSYFKWAAYAAIAAVLRSDCYVKTKVGITIYPNVYVVLLSSRSSITRKSQPMDLAYKLVNHVDNTHIIAGRASLPGIVKVLSTVKTNQSGARLSGASGFLFSQELTGLLYKDSDTLDQLTDWYMYYEKWPVTLSGGFEDHGIKYLDKLCITMLGATNDENISALYDTRAQKGGLLARTMLVRESKRRFIKSYFEGDPIGDFKPFLDEIKDISKMKGRFTLLPEAEKEFDSWYHTIKDDQISSSGIEARIQTHAVKLSMILSASYNRSKIITRDHMIEAIDECCKLLPNYKVLSQTIAVNSNVKIGALILRELLMAPKYTMSIRNILQKLWIEGLDKKTLTDIIETYQEAGLIDSFIDHSRAEAAISLTEEAIKKYQENKE